MAKRKSKLNREWRTIDRRVWDDPKFQEIWAQRYERAYSVPSRHPWPYKLQCPRECRGLSLRHRFHKISKKMLPRVLARLGEKCIACGSTENIRPDHVIPIAWGGTNDLENLQPLCHDCNSSKGGSLPSPPKEVANG